MAKIDRFNFPPGMVISKKFEIIRKLGEGYESEVYFVKELATGIERTAKFFFPHMNEKNKVAKFYAQKLHRLKNCSILIQYLTQETIRYRKINITYLISEYIEGVTLDDFLADLPGRRLPPFQALHLLYALAKGIEDIHLKKEYHGDLHTSNVIIQRFGINFDLKVLDFFHWGAVSKENIQYDVACLIRIFYEVLGGKKYYASQPQYVKDICLGLKNSLIAKKFKKAGHLRRYLEGIAL